VAPVSS